MSNTTNSLLTPYSHFFGIKQRKLIWKYIHTYVHMNIHINIYIKYIKTLTTTSSLATLTTSNQRHRRNHYAWTHQNGCNPFWLYNISSHYLNKIFFLFFIVVTSANPFSHFLLLQLHILIHMYVFIWLFVWVL